MSKEPEAAPSLSDLTSRKLGQASLIANRIVAGHLEAFASHRFQYAVLSLLKEDGPASQAELCRRAGIDRSDMVAILNELETAGKISRAPDPGDRRRNVVSLSNNGEAFQAELSRAIANAQEDLLAPLSNSERATLSALLDKLLTHHGAH